MLVKLSLTNFQKHEDLVIDFTQGLNAIRGNNENGKSSVFRAIAYAFFGSRALPMSLEETVTWGKPVASLKVELTFTHAGKQFKIVRKKSGAELTGDGVVASGQAEATAFVESLFGASASIAQATMLANQSSLQNGLDSSAMPLIEKLANMSLIDELVGKIQERLPSGSTKGVEAQLATVVQGEAPVLDTAALDCQISNLTSELAEVSEKHQGQADKLSKLEAPASAAQKKLRNNQAAQQLVSTLQSQIDSLKPSLVVPEFSAPDLAELEALVVQASKASELRAAYAKFEALPQYPTMPTSDLEAKEAEASVKVSEFSSSASNLKAALAGLRSSRITETACGLCGKDLSDVPEVVAKNAKLDADIDRISAGLAEIEQNLTASKSLVQSLAVYRQQASKLRAHFPLKFVELDETFTPPVPQWVGGMVPPAGEQPDYKGELEKAKAAIAAHSRKVQTAEIAAKQIADIEAKLQQVQLSELTEEEQEALATIEAVKSEFAVVQQDRLRVASALKDAESRLTTEKAVYAAKLQAWEASQAQRAQLVELLAKYHFHNGIISKLREARPVVAAKLWALVLAGVSHYFSQIRGVASTVTRGEKGFLIDGKAVEAFSGSTKDSLGLAIRLMLQKTFLPNVGFMLADEPGAAFDGARESDMLAVLAGSGLDQVILVTHSDLADTFASNVITI